MKNLKKFAALILAITFVLSAFTVPASAVQTMEMELTPPDSELDHRPGYFTHLQVTQLTLFHRVRPGTQGHEPWGQLTASTTVQVTWEDWNNVIFHNGIAFIRVIVASGAHLNRVGFVNRAHLTAPAWWISLS